MKTDVAKNPEIREYLLGKAPPEVASELETRLMIEPDLYEEVSIAEEELIDQYVAGQLVQSERESFESLFLAAPERRRKMHFAQSLKRYVDLGQPNDVRTEARKLFGQAKTALQRLHARNPFASYSIAFAVLVLMLGISWLVIHTMRTESINGPGNVVSAVLVPGLGRDGGSVDRITIPIDTDTLRLDLILEGDAYRSYRAVLLRDDGSEAWRGEDFKLQNKMGNRFIVVNIPASALTTGDYQIKVSGKLPNDTFEPVDGYRFGAVK